MGLALIALGCFLTASLLTFDAAAYREAWAGRGGLLAPLARGMLALAGGGAGTATGPLARLYANAGGGLGVGLAGLGLRLLGALAVWALPALLLGWGWNRLLVRPLRRPLWRTAAALPLTLTVAAVAAAFTHASPAWGGSAGAGFWRGTRGAVGPVGGLLVLAVAAVGFLVLEAEAWDGRWGTFTRALLRGLAAAGRWAGVHLAAALRWSAGALWWALRNGGLALGRLLRDGGLALGGLLRDAAFGIKNRSWESGADVDGLDEDEEPAPAPSPRRGRPAPVPVAVTAGASAPAPDPALPRIVDGDAASETPASAHPAPVLRRPGERVEESAKDVEDAVLEARRRAREGRKSTPSVLAAMRGRMEVPSAEILDDVPEVGPPVAEEELLENSRILTQTLRDFGVTGRVGEVHPGPVITRYEYAPGPGVKVAQILNREDDLALKLRASRIRIIAPIPGKAAVGIEVPNRNPAPIFLRRLLETRVFSEASGPLPLALGRDIGGAPVITELSKMPHLLIAGTTGSGKSVCMNALITSLLLKRTPEELRLLMIDPKMLELPMYNGIPHLMTEVVTDPKLAARSLKWLLIEMERRYRVLSARGCRNITSYNQKMDKEGPVNDGEEKLPYIVVLIDELADLMITSGKEVEEPIARLAQTARAVGIHLIVATQRPSVDVITGVIKANFPARIAFQVASRIDSRTILDQNGAESLLGKGDMLFLPPGQAAPVRVHGAFVSESETQRLAEAWRDQGEPEAHPELEEAMAEPEAAAGGLGDDPLFEEAARLVVAAGQASASLLQRRLKVGYARAARLVDMLEMAGVVSPQDGSKAREVLVDEVRLEHVLAGE